MANSTIGIKIADGSFYPIVEKDSQKWKRLVLTTARDGQTSVQIDLYEGEETGIESAQYVGSLLIENIAPTTAGESEIELQIGIEKDGKLSARAEDLSSGESQSLKVSLESLTGENIYDVPEFELENEFDTERSTERSLEMEFPEDMPDEEEDRFEEEDREEYAGEEHAPSPRRRPLLLALFIVIGIAAIAALAIFLYQLFQGPEVPPLQAQREAPAVIASETVSTGDDASVTTGAEVQSGGSVNTLPAETGTQTSARDGPVAESSGASPSAPEQGTDGVWYWIRWGDTLWDISRSFYRNPWQYEKIAKENSIRNPDLIFAGAALYIPTKE